jgi:hypothetical protein
MARESAICVLLFLLAGYLTGSAAAEPRLVPARTHMKGDFPSPDGRYVAHGWYGQAEVAHLSIRRVRRDSRGKTVVVRPAIIADLEDVTSFQWVPRQPHALVIATSGLYGKAMLVLWQGDKRLRSLHRVKRPDEETFWLRGITADGMIAIFEHAMDNENLLYHDPKRPRLRLRLPLSPRSSSPGPHRKASSPLRCRGERQT